MHSYLLALIGGILIGLSAALFLLFNGKLLGVSGIVGGLFEAKAQDPKGRIAFLVGLLSGGLILKVLHPQSFAIELHRSIPVLIIAGLLVGYGTQLGKGCTSGHGICGVSRFSPRSLLATILFMATGAMTVFVLNHLLGGSL